MQQNELQCPYCGSVFSSLRARDNHIRYSCSQVPRGLWTWGWRWLCTLVK